MNPFFMKSLSVNCILQIAGFPMPTNVQMAGALQIAGLHRARVVQMAGALQIAGLRGTFFRTALTRAVS